MENLERKIAELGRAILGGDVALCHDSEMILDRCIGAVSVSKVQDVLGVDRRRPVTAATLRIR